ncbi:hypothetical protein GCM10009119_38690 [Algoriphagus jejuensis]|uniref:Dolichyl-phosphate-mannose-protein mannosyltransferase n=1 Tax=Algoriphagus jejuensis TaxID=419934 RepID=A0ABP3YK27_9BACT
MGLTSRERFVLVWTLLGAVGVIVIWFLPWRFQVNDDEIMMWLVSGAYTGTPETYAVFIHPALSWCFAKLYTLAPEMKWYPACWFLVMYLSYLGYLRLIWAKVQDHLSAQVWSLFSLCLLVHFLFFLQFSIVSAFAISAGFANRFGRESAENSLYFGLYVTDLLLLIGFLIRPEVLFLFLAAYLVLNLLTVRNLHLLKRLALPALILVLGYGLSQWWIEASGLGEFQRTNTLRSQVFDHPMLQLYKDEYRVTDPDLYHFANGLMDFGRDNELDGNLESWKSKLDEQRGVKFGVGFLASNLTTYINHERFFIGLMGLFVAFSLFLHWKLAMRFFLVLGMIVLLLSPFFLLKIQIYALVFLAYFSSSLSQTRSERFSRVPMVGIMFTLLLAMANHLYSYTKSSQNRRPDKNLNVQITSIQEQGHREVYLIGAGNLYTDLLFQKPLPFKTFGWPTLLEKYRGVNVSSERVYLVDSATFASNSAYFDSEIQIPSTSDQVLLVYK